MPRRPLIAPTDAADTFGQADADASTTPLARILTAVAALAAAAALVGYPLASASSAAPLPLAPGPGKSEPSPSTPSAPSAPGSSAAGRDELTVTVARTGSVGLDGTYRLRCAPAGGDHPRARAACEALEHATARRARPFAPVPADSNCTRIYGGPATARVVGTWHGEHVDARFRRTDGCEIDRWNKLVPVLPKTMSGEW